MTDSASVLTSVPAVIDAIGGNDAVRTLTGATPQKLSNWRAEGRFPATTYVVFSTALEQRGKRASPKLWGQQSPRRGRR